ncbi:SHOCT-like domain-containing protein, partial [Dysosmobacter welbionis]
RHFSHHRESSVNKPYEKVSKLEHKADAADAKLQYERNQQEHPEMKKQNMN